ncbi:MAG: sulfur oxidation c-type cytochrome SoxX [Hyphomicrobiaceae bacterium]
MTPRTYIAALVVAGLGLAPSVRAAGPLEPFTVTGDRISRPLGGMRGDAGRGKAIVFNPEAGNCAICHRVPGGDARFQGDVGPSLAGVAGRLDEGQIRLRLVDGTRLNPDTIMPAYYRVEGLRRVREKYAGKPVLTTAEIEDVVAFLMTLKE